MDKVQLWHVVVPKKALRLSLIVNALLWIRNPGD